MDIINATVFEAVYMGAIVALQIPNRAMARDLARLTCSVRELEAAIDVMRAATPGDRVWPALEWLRRRRAEVADTIPATTEPTHAANVTPSGASAGPVHFYVKCDVCGALTPVGPRCVGCLLMGHKSLASSGLGVPDHDEPGITRDRVMK